MMLAVTSLSLAIARGQAPAVGAIALCSGAGMAMLPVDAQGNPTGPPHVCPDGVAAFVSVDVPAPVLSLHRSADGEQLTHLRSVQLANAPRVPAQARGPPV